MPWSRIPWTKSYDKLADKSVTKAIISASTVTNHSNTAVEFSYALITDDEIKLGAGKVVPSKITNKEWIEEQMSDPIIGEIRKAFTKLEHYIKEKAK